MDREISLMRCSFQSRTTDRGWVRRSASRFGLGRSLEQGARDCFRMVDAYIARMVRSAFLGVALLGVLVCSAGAQGTATISGTVRDSLMRPIPNADVIVVP